jgi:GT2 family glycosyltransferase
MPGAVVAFLVVTWNNEAIIGGCLDSILAQQGVDARVFVLDNASADGTVAAVKRYPSVKLIESSTNTGFAHGNNVLIRAALSDPATEYFALVNSDATLDPAWAQTLTQFAATKTRLGALQGLTLDYFDHSTVDSHHIFVNARFHGVQAGHGDPLAKMKAEPQRVFGVNAAAALFTRALAEGLPDQGHDFFDERFFMYYEDVDLAYRAAVAGFESWTVPAARAFHMGSVSAKQKSNVYAHQMVARNQTAMIVKNTPLKVMVRQFPQFVAGVGYFLLKTVRGEAGVAAMLKVAAWWLYGALTSPRYLASRRAIRRASRLDDATLLRFMRGDGTL